MDVILVDAPAGDDRPGAPGRMKPIAAAARLAAPAADVFVHDCDRPVEQLYADTYLTDGRKVAAVGKLRHYRLA